MNLQTSSTPSVFVLEPGQSPAAGAVLQPTSHQLQQQPPGALPAQQPAPARRARLHPAVALAGVGLLAVAATAAGMWAIMKPASPPPMADIAPVAAPAPEVACRSCGRVESVSVFTAPGRASGMGAVGGAVAGGAVGHQFGRGNGKKVLTAIGAVGGAIAGHEAEKVARTERTWTVTVRMNDGSVQRIQQGFEPGWHTGDPVRVADGRVVPR